MSYDQRLVRIMLRQAGARTTLTIAAALALFANAGCGLGPSAGTSKVTLTVTRDFGARRLGVVSEPRAPGGQTVLQLLERSFGVRTADGGRIVESIDGLAGAAGGIGWTYFVNGIASNAGASRAAVRAGDRIWWDLDDRSGVGSVPAVVGSFPEPFVHGSGGRRLPTVLECAADVGTACSRVAAALTAIGVPFARQAPGTGSGTDSLAVLVGTWSDLRASLAAELVEHGPAASGVYAKFAGPGGRTLELLDPQGGAVRALGAGAGLIAATSQSGAEPTWLVTGTNAAGVSAAAGALTSARLDGHFALAVQSGADLPLPR